MKFYEFKKYLSFIDRLSICDKETLKYKNYININEVDNSYDDFYVYGVGIIDSEFYLMEDGRYSSDSSKGDLRLVSCIEIMLDKKPRFEN